MPDFLADILSLPENSYWRLAISTAKEWGREPLDYLAPDGLGPRYDAPVLRRLNRKLEMAFKMLNDETCPDCGVPIWIGHSTLATIGFDVHTTTCYGCGTKQEVVNDQKNGLGPGTTAYVTPVAFEGTSLPHRMDNLPLSEAQLVEAWGVDDDDDEDADDE